MTTTTGLTWLYKEHLNFKSIPPANDGALSYLKAILICVKGDGTISEAERAWVIGYAEAFGASAQNVEALKTYAGDDDLVAVTANEPAIRRDALYDAIRASYADGELAAGERQVIERLATQLGFTADLVAQLEAIYLAECAVKEARLKLTYPQGLPY